MFRNRVIPRRADGAESPADVRCSSHMRRGFRAVVAARNDIVAAFIILLLALPLLAQDPQMKTSETITVERILIDARVTLGSGDPVMHLGVNDFKVRIDGRPAKVESVEWIPDTAAGRELADIDKTPQREPSGVDIPEPQGRLIVVFFQTDFSREDVRIRGQMKILGFADGSRGGFLVRLASEIPARLHQSRWRHQVGVPRVAGDR